MIHIFSLLLLVQESMPEWGSFRGSLGNGHAVAGKLPSSLNLEQDVLWRVEVPQGYSSPIVSGQHVVLTAAEGRELHTLCLDRDTGEEHWRRTLEYDGQRVGQNSAAAPSPVTDGSAIYALFHNRGLVAYDFDGEDLWARELGVPSLPHGLSASPVLAGDKLILQVDQDQGSYLLALDKRTGAELWRTPRPSANHAYSTPSLYRPAEGPHELLVFGTQRLESYGLEGGKLIRSMAAGVWEPKSTPLVVGERCYLNFFVAPGGPGSPPMAADFAAELALRDADADGLLQKTEWPELADLGLVWRVFDRDQDNALSESEWMASRAGFAAKSSFKCLPLSYELRSQAFRITSRRALPDNSTALCVGDVLFLAKDGGMLTTLDALDGKVLKQKRLGTPGRYFASPVTDGERVLLSGGNGQLALVTAKAQWELLSSVDLNEEVWSTPAIAGEQLFVRTQAALWCFGKPRQALPKGD